MLNRTKVRAAIAAIAISVTAFGGVATAQAGHRGPGGRVVAHGASSSIKGDSGPIRPWPGLR